MEPILVGAMIIGDDYEQQRKTEDIKSKEHEEQLVEAEKAERPRDDAEQEREEKQARTEMTEWEQLRADRLARMENPDRNTTENLDHSRSDYERENGLER